MPTAAAQPGQARSKRWIAVVNPSAGRGRAGARWPALARALAAAGIDAEPVRTRGPGDAERRVAEHVQAGERQFLAVGGDGTLHEVANAILASGARGTLAAAPLGTGNDWARGLGVPRDDDAVARMIATGHRRSVDAGRIEYSTPAGTATRCFVNVAGAGYDAWVIERLPAGGPHGLAYFAGLLRGLWRYEAAAYAVDSVPGGFRVRAPLFAAFAAIGPYCGGGMRFAPGADFADGLLELVAVPHLGPFAALRRLPRLYTGRLHADPVVKFARAAAVTIDATPAVRIEADGQLLGHTPARIEILRGAIDTIVPTPETAR
jgi:diacylglycerol kinase (ATP)